jgi:phage terminase small subunit
MKSHTTAESWTSTDPAKNFSELWKVLTDAGLVAHVDESLVRLLSERLAQYASLRDEAMGAATLLPLGSGSMAVNPILKFRDEASKDCARLMRACALTPLSRRGLAKIREVCRPGGTAHYMPLTGEDKPDWMRRLDGDEYEAPAQAAGLWADLKPDDYEGDFAT